MEFSCPCPVDSGRVSLCPPVKNLHWALVSRVFVEVLLHQPDDLLAMCDYSVSSLPPLLGEGPQILPDSKPQHSTHMISGVSSPILHHLVNMTHVWIRAGANEWHSYFQSLGKSQVFRVSPRKQGQMLVKFLFIQQVCFSVSLSATLFELLIQCCSPISWTFLSHYDKNDDLTPTISI